MEAVCTRCGVVRIDIEFREGCANCALEGTPANFTVVAQSGRKVRGVLLGVAERKEVGMWAFAPLIEGTDDVHVSLGEGSTPLLLCARVGAWAGVPQVYIKNETVNPTWSHKDRYASVAISRLVSSGNSVAAVASTGNLAMSVAAYASRANLRAVVVGTSEMPAPVRAALRTYGAEVVLVRSMVDRYKRLRSGVKREGWFALSNSVSPPVGSEPIGIQGYKTIAYEVWGQLGGKAPDWVVVPTGYGDCLAGIWCGLKELLAARLIDRLPRLAAAERFGAVESHLAGTHGMGPVATQSTRAVSIGTAFATWQSVWAIRESHGVAEGCSEAEVIEARTVVGANEGLFLEYSSAAALAVVRRLVRRRLISEKARVVIVGTGGGCKMLGE